MNGNRSFEIRHFGMEQLEPLVALSAGVGWNQPAGEIREVIARSGKYLVGAFAGEELVGVAAGYPYPDGGFVYINEVIVREDWRRCGVATALMERILALVAGDYPTQRLCATAMGRPLYARFGFFPYATLSFGDFGSSADLPVADGEFIPLTDSELTAAGRLDRENFGADRSALIASLVRSAPGDAWCLRRGGRAAGFIVRAPMNWLFQCSSGADMAALLRYANARSARGPLPALLHKEHVELLGVAFDEHFQLTLMQRGTAVPPPGVSFSGFLPDIG